MTKLSQHLSCPTKADWVIVKQVLRYIRGTLNYKLTFTKSKTEKVNLVGYSDADWASSVEDRKSTTGYLFYMNEEGPAISWKSKKQSTIALSSCEAEYMALTACTQEAMFLKMLLSEFEEQPNQCTPIYGDNQGAIALIKSPNNHTRSKHIDIKYHFIREKFHEQLIDVLYVPSNENIADLFTKPSTRNKLDTFNRTLFGKSKC